MREAAVFHTYIWDDYCRQHVERYGKRFVPDENPNWDR